MARALARVSERKASGVSRETPELTPRQREILELLSEGKSAKSIGQELSVAEATVRGHIRALLRAFGVHSQVEALARARETGLIGESARRTPDQN